MKSQVAGGGWQVAGGGGNAAEIRLAKGTGGLLKQAAEHMSKLLGGESVGRFPGFEPPDDDERYRNKIRNQSYSGEEANHWIKESNNFLRQIVRKNPGLTMEEILYRLGWEASEIDEFIIAFRNTHYIAKSLKELGVGVSPATLETLEALMEILGVVPWPI